MQCLLKRATLPPYRTVCLAQKLQVLTVKCHDWKIPVDKCNREIALKARLRYLVLGILTVVV